MSAEIIIAGGTFEKDYFDNGQVDFYGEDQPTATEEILQLAKALHHSVKVAMLIDSLDMYDEHREELVDMCRNSDSDSLVVVHGTDTMDMTARALQTAELEKTIAVTGAMRPHRLGDSDAGFNLGFALANAMVLPNGVYVTMNGRVFFPNNVQKNKTLGAFEKIID